MNTLPLIPTDLVRSQSCPQTPGSALNSLGIAGSATSVAWVNQPHFNAPSFVACQDRRELAETEWNAVDNQDHTTIPIGCDPAAERIVQHSAAITPATEVTYRHPAPHFQAQPAKGIIGAGLAIG